MKIDREFTDASEGSDVLGAYIEMEKYLFKWVNFIYGTDNFFNEYQLGNSSTKEIRDLIRKIRARTKLDNNLELMYNEMKMPCFISSTKDGKDFYEGDDTVLLRRKNKWLFTDFNTTIDNKNMLLVDRVNDMRVGFSTSQVKYPVSVVMFIPSRNDANKLINKLSHSSESLPGDPQLIKADRLIKCSQYPDNDISNKIPLHNEGFTGTYMAYLPTQIENRIFRDFLIDRPCLDKSLLETEDGKAFIVEKYMNSFSNGRLIYTRDDMTNVMRLGFEVGLSGSYTYDISKERTERVNGLDPIVCTVTMNFNIDMYIPSIIHYRKTYNNLSGSVFSKEEIDMITNRISNIERAEKKTGIFIKDFHIKENMKYLNLYLDNKITTQNMNMSNDDILRQQDIMVAAMRLLKRKGTNDGNAFVLVGENRFYEYFKNELDTTADSLQVNLAILAGSTLDQVIIKDGKQLNLSSLVEFDMRNAVRIENIKKTEAFKKLKFPKGGTWWVIKGLTSSSDFKRKRYKLKETGEYVDKMFLDKTKYENEEEDEMLFETKLFVDFYRTNNELSTRSYVEDYNTGDLYINHYYPTSTLSQASYLQIF